MADSQKVNAAPARTESAGPVEQPVAERHICGEMSSSASPALQLDSLTHKFEAALSAALRRNASAPPPTISLLTPERVHERAPDQEIAVLLPPTGSELDNFTPPLPEHAVQPSRALAKHPHRGVREKLLSVYRALLLEGLPHTGDLIAWHNGQHSKDQRYSTELADCTDAVDRPEGMASQQGSIARWPRGWDNSLIRQGAIPVAILIALAGVGAVLLLPGVPSGHLPTENVAIRGATKEAPAIGAADREPNDRRWAVADDRMDQEPAVHVVQEPVTPKLVKPVRIPAEPDQATGALPRPELTSFAQLNDTSAEQREVSAVAGADEQAGERAPASMDEALIETKPHSVEPNRWPNAIPSDDDVQSGNGLAAAGRADKSDLPDYAKATAAGLTPGAAAALEPPAAEIDDSSESATTRSRQAANPTRIAPVTTHANMRAGQGNHAAVITVVPAGAPVGVIDCAAWCEVVFEGERGWIHRSLVTGSSESGGADRQIAAGTPLVSADGAQIGIIRGLSTDATGQDFVIVNLAHELGGATRFIRLRAEYIAAADGRARINVKLARFVRSLPTQSSAEAGTATRTN